MEKVLKTFKAIFEIIKNPRLLNNILSDISIWNNYLIKKHKITNGFPVIEIDQLFPNFNVTLNCLSFLGGGSLPTDIALLKLLCNRFEKCTYFEIGTWRGESVVNVAENAEICYTLNFAKTEILSLELDEEYADLHGFFSKEKKNIIHLEGNSLNYDFKGLKQKFDVIFIDGGHDYKHVKNDTEKVFKYLTHDKSIVVWHDYAYHPELLRPEVIAGIIDGLSKEHQKNLYHVSNTMCAIFTKEKLKTTEFTSPIIPNKTFLVKISSKEIN